MRKLSWAIIIVNILFAMWVVGGSASNADNCDGLAGDELAACEAGTAIGTGIGAAIICGIWLFVDIILLVIFVVTQPKQETVVYVQANGKPN